MHTKRIIYNNQTGDISTLNGSSLKLVDKFTNQGSSVSSTEAHFDTPLTKAWTAINRHSVIWKSGLTDKMKHSFFQEAIVSILLYGCTTCTLIKRLKRSLTATTQECCEQYWTSPRGNTLQSNSYTATYHPSEKTIKIRRTRQVGHCWRSGDKLISDEVRWTTSHGRAKAGRPAWTYIQQLCADTGCSPEDLPEAMDNRERWWQRVRDMRADTTTWWWWWWYLIIYLLNLYTYSTHPVYSLYWLYIYLTLFIANIDIYLSCNLAI